LTSRETGVPAAASTPAAKATVPAPTKAQAAQSEAPKAEAVATPAAPVSPPPAPTINPADQPTTVILSSPTVLAQLDPQVKPKELYLSTSAGVAVYILDGRDGSVYQVTEGGQNAMVYQAGVRVAGTDVVGGPARSLTGRQNLVQIIDDKQQLFHFIPPNRLEFVPITREGVSSAQAAATYEQNLYVLDPAANTIHRFRPAANGTYTNRDAYFAATSGVNLANAIDLAIDGHVYVLFSDGTIRRYLGGAPAAFSLEGLPTPLGKPVQLYIREGMGSLYILDTANDRIVQVTREGRYQRQFRAPGGIFANAADFAVNANETSLWVVGSGQVTQFSLPANVARSQS
jgi:hypothetical protein